RPFWFRAVPGRFVRRILLGRHGTPALGQFVEAVISSVSPAALAARARAVLAVDVGAQLQSCPVPVLYLLCTEDRMVPRRCLPHIRRLYPPVEVVTVIAPHLLLQTAAEESARVIERFATGCHSPPTDLPTSGSEFEVG